MNKLLFSLIVVALLQAGATCSAQYYGYNHYYQMPRQAAPIYRQYVNPGGFPAYQFRLAPPPQVFRQWDLRNRSLDLEALQRSPLDPESPNDYLLRTF
jgi:hypothetical protein